MKTPFFWMLIVAGGLLLSACTYESVISAEVTRIVPQTVIVTQIVSPTPSPKQTAVSMPKPTEPDQNTAYLDGLVTITTYTNLIEGGQYVEAYQLYCQFTKDARSVDDFIQDHNKARIKTFKILKAMPFYLLAQQNNITPYPETDYKKWIYVEAYTEGDGGMAGARPNGLNTYTFNIVWEDGEWKICTYEP